MDLDEIWWTGWVCDEDEFLGFSEKFGEDPDQDTRILLIFTFKPTPETPKTKKTLKAPNTLQDL